MSLAKKFAIGKDVQVLSADREDGAEPLVPSGPKRSFGGNGIAESHLKCLLQCDKDKELMEGRLGLLGMVEPYVGRYYSTEYVRSNVLRQKDAEIVEIDEQIEDEIASGVLPDPNQQMLEMEQGAFGDPMADPMQQQMAGMEVPPAPQPQKMPKDNEGEI